MNTQKIENTCDKIDVKRIGCIQDIGVVMKIKDGRIASISDNASRYPWISLDSIGGVIGKVLDEVVSATTASSIKYLIDSSTNNTVTLPGEKSRVLGKDVSTDVTISITRCRQDPTSTCVWFVPSSESCFSKGFNYMNMNIESVDSCCEYLRISMGYDRGMVYKFFDDSTGEVTFESVNSDVKYKGLRFPAGDVPSTVRKQYLVDRVRFISDTSKPQSDIVGDTSVDLSSCDIRGVSHFHIDYLKNMGVRSSMSIGLVVNDVLWGLLVFHSWSKPITPSSKDISMVTITSSLISLHLEKKVNSEWVSRQLQLENLISDINVVSNMGDFISVNEEHLLRIFNCNTLCYGDTHGDKFNIAGDDTALGTSDIVNMGSTQSYGKMESPRRSYARISHSNFFIIFIRMGYTNDVAWGGDPGLKPKNPDNNETIPRKSFESFVKRTAQTPPEWDHMDKDMVSIMARFLDRMIYQKTLRENENNIKIMKERVEDIVDSSKSAQSFFAHMSHELRTPFHGVMSILHLIKEGKLDAEDIRMYIDMAIECGDTMINTLNDILSISKGATSYSGETRVFNLLSVVNSTTDVLNQTASSQGITIQSLFDVDAGVCLDGHAMLVKQMIANLYGNAIKFTDNGGTIVLSTKVFESLDCAIKEWDDRSLSYIGKYVAIDPYTENIYGPEYVHVSISVTDTGCGISPASIGKIFDAYHQISSGEEKIYQGSGLGLNICMINAKRMNARLSVSSTKGEGTYFNCIVPMKRGCSPEKQKIEQAIIEHDVLDDDAPKSPVFLVVDDALVNVKLATKKISSGVPGAIVHSSSNGLEGYNRFKELVEDGTVVHGIFMDYHMPIMSGTESIARIRSYESSKNMDPTPIMAFTADLTESSKKKLIDSGANMIIQKPVGKGVLIRTCIDLLNEFVKNKMGIVGSVVR